jgi:checkpoint serine/threonine-protein kinase
LKYPNIFSLHVYQDKGFLLMDCCDGTLQDVINAYRQRNARMDEALVIYYTIEMMRMIETLHNAHIIHGDIKPDNFLILNEETDDEWVHWQPGTQGGWGAKGLRLIDYGRSIDLSLYPEGTIFEGDNHADSFRCIEMQTGKPWSYQVGSGGYYKDSIPN